MDAPVALSHLKGGFEQPVSARIVAVASEQKDLITTEQLVSLGTTERVLSGLVSAGWLIRVHRGVYLVAGANLDGPTRWLAATLACGPRARIAYLSAGANWNAWPMTHGDPHVVIVGTGRAGHPGIAVHRMRRSHPDDFTVHNGIPTTSLELTCLHLATMASEPAFRRAVVKAARRPEFSSQKAIELCERSYGRPGVSQFRRVIHQDLEAEIRSLSELELRFVELLRHHSIALPAINHDVESFMVDVVWKEQRLIVELDGFAFHRLARDLRRDNLRTRKLVASGYRVVRFTWQDVTTDPAGVTDTVKRLLAESSYPPLRVGAPSPVAGTNASGG